MTIGDRPVCDGREVRVQEGTHQFLRLTETLTTTPTSKKRKKKKSTAKQST